MRDYLIRRLLSTVVLFFALTLATYIIFFVLPLQRTGGTRFLVETQNQRPLALTGPIWREYLQFLGHVAHGSLGRSFVTRQDVTTTLAEAAPVTASLVIGGALLCLLIAVPIGILAALRPRSFLDRASTIAVLIGVSAHPIWIGLILSYVLGFRLHLTPIAGYCGLIGSATGCRGPFLWAYHLLLPWITFAVLFAAVYMRMVRASVLETLEQDYVRTARAKGAGEAHVLRTHVLRNAMLPLVTMLGMDMGLAFGGVVFVESVFGLPGIGRQVVSSLRMHDLPMIVGIVVWTTTAILICNLVVDLLYAWIDPRIRLDRTEQAEPSARTSAPPRRLRVPWRSSAPANL